jgi:hypothetical protein
MVRHPECYERSTKVARSAVNAPGRYSLLGLSEDILEVTALAAAGAAGPLGPNFERLYWDWNGEGSWTLERPTGDSMRPS